MAQLITEEVMQQINQIAEMTVEDHGAGELPVEILKDRNEQ